ncbi:armadillo-type protein [Xylogone sp. PMI_703]|nr:armadillo-type protein [Xylogone sp. PMI_703]
MTNQEWLQQLRSSRSPIEQIAALRAIKNEIIGHSVKKEAVVSLGVLDSIARISCSRTNNRENGKTHGHTFASRSLTEEESVRLQGLHIIASIALGGPSFIAALHSASVVPTILSNLCPSNNPPLVVLAALRALSNLADSLALASSTHPLNTNSLADTVFIRQHLQSLCHILSQTSYSSTVQSQINTAASLIGKLCREERHQQGLANSGVLDALASRLASFVVAEGLVIPGADILAQKDGLQEYFPAPAPKSANLAAILQAIAVIIEDSKLRASQLLYSPPILAIFPLSLPDELIPLYGTRSTWNSFNSASVSSRQSQLNAVDFLLPLIPLHQLKNSTVQATAFPPLGSSGSREHLPLNSRSGANNSDTSIIPSWGSPLGFEVSTKPHASSLPDTEEPESPLISYLIYIIRSRAGIERLMAASVLTILYRAGLTHKSRDTAITLLVVPLLVHILDDDLGSQSTTRDNYDDTEATAIDWTIKERAPAILAMLITDSEYLQKAAFEANAVSKLSKMLKVSYDPVPEAANLQSWSPQGDDESEPMGLKQPSQPDSRGQSPLLLHKICVRESTLKAIAALVPFQDEYRKAVVEQGVIPYIVESMSASPRKPTPKLGERTEKELNGSRDQDTKTAGYGVNPVSVMVAACGAIRALSRSVSILRTTLIDNGVAMPVFRLLRHPDIEVQIAATATVCNLVTDVSPMREVITEAGVLKILCEHAHSMNAKLRLNALWALKHFVHAVGNDMKRMCLEELGQGWLVQLISDDTEGNSDKAVDEGTIESMDVDMDMDRVEDSSRSTNAEFSGHPGLSRSSSIQSKSIQQAESRLAALREAELNPARKARKDDIAVQEQGLDFIRNLIGGAGQGGTSGPAEMIDFLFNTLGQDRVFQILTNKLRPKPVNPFGRRGTVGTETRILPPQSEIITAVGYILVHMAASEPRHRQLIIAQTELLTLLVPQFNHPNIEVRLALCWLVTNLTWMDDASDGPACAARAHELRKLGFLTKLEILEQEDPELNVRERAKSALWQMKKGY